MLSQTQLVRMSQTTRMGQGPQNNTSLCREFEEEVSFQLHAPLVEFLPQCRKYITFSCSDQQRN